jgi:hypothetical protein
MQEAGNPLDFFCAERPVSVPRRSDDFGRGVAVGTNPRKTPIDSVQEFSCIIHRFGME